MLETIANTPPEVAFAVGFFMALSLRQGRLELVMDKIFGDEDRENE